MSQQLTVKSIFEKDTVKEKIQQMLGRKATGFITSVLQIVNNNALLSKVNPLTVYNAAMIAATLDLPINPNLGFAWIVPYKGEAQFQMGWKGYVQLAQRTKQYQRINCTKVYENQFKSYNYLTEELDADFLKVQEGKVIGYAAYFRLNNGFEKTVYWTKEQVQEHGKKFSKSYNSATSAWNTDFDSMAMKTVLKSTLSKWGILSIEMQTAVTSDSSVIKDYENNDVKYVDNEEEKPIISEDELEQAITEIKEGNTTLDAISDLYDLYPEQIEYLKTAKK